MECEASCCVKMIMPARFRCSVGLRERYPGLMPRQRKALHRLLSGDSDRAIRFDQLVSLLRFLRFELRRRTGSHHIFVCDDFPEIINLQVGKDGMAKPYQVRQIRAIILKYRLHVSLLNEADDDDRAT